VGKIQGKSKHEPATMDPDLKKNGVVGRLGISQKQPTRSKGTGPKQKVLVQRAGGVVGDREERGAPPAVGGGGADVLGTSLLAIQKSSFPTMCTKGGHFTKKNHKRKSG